MMSLVFAISGTFALFLADLNETLKRVRDFHMMQSLAEKFTMLLFLQPGTLIKTRDNKICLICKMNRDYGNDRKNGKEGCFKTCKIVRIAQFQFTLFGR